MRGQERRGQRLSPGGMKAQLRNESHGIPEHLGHKLAAMLLLQL